MILKFLSARNSKKNQLSSIGHKVKQRMGLTQKEIEEILAFQNIDEDPYLLAIMKKTAVPVSLAFGFVLAVWVTQFETLSQHLPTWTNLSPELLSGVNYLWNLLSEPIENPNILFHIPNLILYSFGVVGIKKLLDTLERRSWVESVLAAQAVVQQRLANGELDLLQSNGHSILFVGQGDFIGMQFAINHKASMSTTLATQKPKYTLAWNQHDGTSVYDDLKEVLQRASGHNAGEYFFFPVKDDQIFLPGPKSYDVSPHKLDILCQNLRLIEQENNWAPKPIFIVGDKLHRSEVHSEDQRQVIKKSQEVISLDSISEKYTDTHVYDPTDIVLQHILKAARGRKIVFRATQEGMHEYKKRFYDRLKSLKYSVRKPGTLTIGYDIFEDLTEQQTLTRKRNNYLPVVLSKNVKDALLRNSYKPEEFLYVPDLVLQTISQAAAQQ